MNPLFTYEELCRMNKKQVIKLAGFRNIKHLLKSGLNKTINPVTKLPMYEKVSKKWVARLVAVDR